MGVLGPIRKPEYTGENRCLPCTVVNVVLVAAVTLLVWVASPVGAVLVAVTGAALIVVRGYVVPYTPQFAPKLTSALPLVPAPGPGASESGSLASEDVDPATALAALEEAEVLAGGAQLELDSEFRAAWEERMRALREADGETVAEAAARAAPFPADGSVVRGVIVVEGRHRVSLVRHVAVVEAAAVETLAAWDVRERYRAPCVELLRPFLEACPGCGGPVVETTRRDCCGGGGNATRNVLACEECEVVLYELPPDEWDEA